MFAIAFDLVVAAAAEHHPRGVTAAYTDIGTTLKKFNFERIQGSVYVCDNNAWRISSPRCWRSKRCRGSRRWSGTSVASASRTGAISRRSSKSLQVPDATIAAFQTERMGVTLTKQRVGRSARVPRPRREPCCSSRHPISHGRPGASFRDGLRRDAAADTRDACAPAFKKARPDVTMTK